MGRASPPARAPGTDRPALAAGPRSVDYLPYTGADPLFYDVLWAAGTHDDTDRVAPSAADAPAGWVVAEHGPWTAFQGPGALPPAGWKVHVSTLPHRAREVVGRAVRIAWQQGVSVKALRTRALVQASQQKYAPRTASGKVVTAYPTDEAALAALVAALAEALAGEPGPGLPGELAVGGAPIFLRHGAFTSTWLPTATGAAVPGVLGAGGVTPDRRGPGGSRELPPPSVRPLLAPPSPQRLDISGVSLVHRSNAGGVYRGTWGDGRSVVLKEARRYAGLDAAGADAPTRLRHERDVLVRLAGTGVAPEVCDYLTVGDSEFLVMTAIPGLTLGELLAARHPALRPDATPESARQYAAWLDSTVTRLRAVVRVLADHGVCHGDLHPSNILDTESGLVLVDFESAALDGRRVATGVAAPGFGGDGPAGPDADLAAVELVRLTLLNSAAHLLSRRPELQPRLEAAGLADLQAPTVGADGGVVSPPVGVVFTGGGGVSTGGGAAAEGGGAAYRAGEAEPAARATHDTDHTVATRLVEDLVAGIRANATPTRRDRLFPGDIATFTLPDGGLGLLHGAAGVALAVRAVGGEVPAAWADWLTERALADVAPTGGLAHGELGVALALARLGRDEAARTITLRALARQGSLPLAPWWEYGCAGRALGYAELADLLSLPEAADAARAHTRACLRVLDQVTWAGSGPGEATVGPERSRRGDDGPTQREDDRHTGELAQLETQLGHGPGLLRGWAGVALALVRLADRADDGALGAQPAELVAAAVRAIRLDARHTSVDHGVLTARHGRRLLPYLGVGAAGIGLAAHCALERLQPQWPGGAADRPELADPPVRVEPAVLAELAELSAGAVAGARVPQMVGAGLLDGRAGILAVLRRIAGDRHPGVSLHRERLEWHAIPVPSDDPDMTPRVLTGAFNLRLSTDLATGSAGALLALGRGDLLHDVLLMPQDRSAAFVSSAFGSASLRSP